MYYFKFADRDTGRWKLDPSETQRRREIFWEIYVYDSWQAGRFSRTLILFDDESQLVSHFRAPTGLYYGPCGLQDAIPGRTFY
jgi:hypothetical protein